MTGWIIQLDLRVMEKLKKKRRNESVDKTIESFYNKF